MLRENVDELKALPVNQNLVIEQLELTESSLEKKWDVKNDNIYGVVFLDNSKIN